MASQKPPRSQFAPMREPNDFNFNLKMPRSMRKQIDQAARENGYLSASDYCRKAIIDALSRDLGGAA